MAARIERLIGDVRAAIIYALAVNDLDFGAVLVRETEKLKRFREWHDAERQQRRSEGDDDD